MILAVGLTPAWQQILEFDAFTPGEVNRARQVHWCAAGKVLNAARALHHLGGPCKALTLVGGTTGREIQRDFVQLGIDAAWLETAAPTRVCTTLLDSNRRLVTELVQEAAPLTAAELGAFRGAYHTEAGAASIVVLIGSLPHRTPACYYHDLVASTTGKVLLDARGPELLEALPARPFLVKPNRKELQQTLGHELRSDDDLIAGMRELNQRGASWVVITNGDRPILACTREEVYRFQPLPARVVNSIGCGDCLTAGVAWALHQGRAPVEAIRCGVAVAADKLGRLLPGEVVRAGMEEKIRAVEVVRL